MDKIERQWTPKKREALFQIAGLEQVTAEQKRIIARLKKKYVRVVKVGNKWNTYLQIDHQGFSVVEQTTKKRAEFFARMLAITLSRVNADK